MKTITWFLRHPLYATHWYLTGRPWSDTFSFWGDDGR
jgi:hypothetical protein